MRVSWLKALELYPIVYESVEGDWNVIVHADPPEGFLSTPGTLQTELQTDDLQTLQFTIVDIGSDWTATRVSHRIRHKGRDRTLVTEAKMVNRQKGRPAKADPGAEASVAVQPTTYALRQNRPDPFYPRTTIEFDLPEAAHVTLRVYDVLGRKVADLVEHRLYVQRGDTTWHSTAADLRQGCTCTDCRQERSPAHGGCCCSSRSLFRTSPVIPRGGAIRESVARRRGSTEGHGCRERCTVPLSSSRACCATEVVRVPKANDEDARESDQVRAQRRVALPKRLP